MGMSANDENENMENRIIKDKKELFMAVTLPQKWWRRKCIESSSMVAGPRARPARSAATKTSALHFFGKAGEASSLRLQTPAYFSVFDFSAGVQQPVDLREKDFG